MLFAFFFYLFFFFFGNKIISVNISAYNSFKLTCMSHSYAYEYCASGPNVRFDFWYLGIPMRTIYLPVLLLVHGRVYAMRIYGSEFVCTMIDRTSTILLF